MQDKMWTVNGQEYQWKIRAYSSKEQDTGTVWGIYRNGILRASYTQLHGQWTVLIVNPKGMSVPSSLYEVASRDWAIAHCTRIAIEACTDMIIPDVDRVPAR